MTIEKDWMTKAGFRAVVRMSELGHRCGYVGVPAGHPLFGVDYSDAHPSVAFPADEEIGKRSVIALLCNQDQEARLDCVFDVHGGLTYSGGREGYPANHDELWWFGYDCGHAGDAPSDEYLAEQEVRHPHLPILWQKNPLDTHRTLDYCINECESLARQLNERVRDVE